MKLKRIRLLTTWDPEPFISRILRYGMLLSVGLIGLGFLWRLAVSEAGGFEGVLEGANVLAFLLADFRNPATRAEPTILFHAGIAVLLVLPCVRILATAWYFAIVERNRRYALLTAALSLILVYVLFLG